MARVQRTSRAGLPGSSGRPPVEPRNCQTGPIRFLTFCENSSESSYTGVEMGYGGGFDASVDAEWRSFERRLGDHLETMAAEKAAAQNAAAEAATVGQILDLTGASHGPLVRDRLRFQVLDNDGAADGVDAGLIVLGLSTTTIAVSPPPEMPGAVGGVTPRRLRCVGSRGAGARFVSWRSSRHRSCASPRRAR